MFFSPAKEQQEMAMQKAIVFCVAYLPSSCLPAIAFGDGGASSLPTGRIL
jgi:hypothetical protein